LTAALVLNLLGGPALRSGQEEPPSPAEGPNEYVSGTVVEYSGGKIVVNRAVPGKPAENHTFTVTAETKIEGDPRVSARVTVGYKTNPETGELIAVRIIVRPQGRK
jgi:hypothetical protein